MAKPNKTENRDTKITLPYRCVSEATQHYAETRDPPSQDPRDHIEQALRHDNSHEKTRVLNKMVQASIPPLLQQLPFLEGFCFRRSASTRPRSWTFLLFSPMDHRSAIIGGEVSLFFTLRISWERIANL